MSFRYLFVLKYYRAVPVAALFFGCLLVCLLDFGSALANDNGAKEGELHTHTITIERPPLDPTPLIVAAVILVGGITALWFLPTKKKKRKK